MKKTVTLLTFIILTFIITYAYTHTKEKEYALDDEQQGIKDQIVIKFSHVVAENTPKGLAAQKFAQLVEKKTNSQVQVEVFPNGILYSDEEAIEALKQGSIQMIAPATSKVSIYIPEFEILDLPFAFPTYDALYQAFRGQLGSSLLSLTAKEGLYGLSFWSNGFKQVTSNDGPLIKPKDFYGQHFRVMPGQIIKEQFEQFYVKTSPLSFNVTYQNLENGTIDGQENTLSNIYSKKFYEVQDYLTISNHGFLSYVVLMNKEYWDQLPREIQQAIQEAMAEATRWNHSNAITMNQQALEVIKHSNINVHTLTEKEKAKWMQKLRPIYHKFSDHFDQALMDELPTKILQNDT